jgi:hypothetical protein
MKYSPVKKHVWLTIAVALLAALILGSCYSYPIKAGTLTQNKHYWDESAAEDQSVELFFATGLDATSYNGIPVEWGKKANVFLPPGQTVFTLDLSFSTGYTTYSGNSIFAWNFKAGDRFILQGWARDGKPGVLLWNMDVKKKWEEYDFFPFPEQGKTILE